MAELSAEQGTKTLWMGDLAYWMDESFIYSIFVGAPCGSWPTSLMCTAAESAYLVLLYLPFLLSCAKY